MGRKSRMKREARSRRDKLGTGHDQAQESNKIIKKEQPVDSVAAVQELLEKRAKQLNFIQQKVQTAVEINQLVVRRTQLRMELERIEHLERLQDEHDKNLKILDDWIASQAEQHGGIATTGPFLPMPVRIAYALNDPKQMPAGWEWNPEALLAHLAQQLIRSFDEMPQNFEPVKDMEESIQDMNESVQDITEPLIDLTESDDEIKSPVVEIMEPAVAGSIVKSFEDLELD